MLRKQKVAVFDFGGSKWLATSLKTNSGHCNVVLLQMYIFCVFKVIAKWNCFFSLARVNQLAILPEV